MYGCENALARTTLAVALVERPFLGRLVPIASRWRGCPCAASPFPAPNAAPGKIAPWRHADAPGRPALG